MARITRFSRRPPAELMPDLPPAGWSRQPPGKAEVCPQVAYHTAMPVQEQERIAWRVAMVRYGWVPSYCPTCREPIIWLPGNSRLQRSLRRYFQAWNARHPDRDRGRGRRRVA